MKNKKIAHQDNFSGFSLKKEITKAIKELGFNSPTPIQKKVIPFLNSSNQDLIASAQTGTGKTAAFGLPILNQINQNSSNDSKISAPLPCP